ncbi:MAG: carboxypeptidase-like regulatory domain-containing protein [Pyrinomonadaceae bacterium]|nr:carboxypeptidase-like regulatory domain-containing protein [Pyrinomonadaceae bacterium]
MKYSNNLPFNFSSQAVFSVKKFVFIAIGVFAFFQFSAFESNVAAQCVSLTTFGSAYTQNFNTLSNTAGSTTNNLTITGWFMTESGGGARDNEQYAVDTGASNTGDTFSYGAAANTERALGGLRTGTLIPLFGACFTNNTGGTIATLNINYTGEQWRLGTEARTDQLNFEYSTNATDLVTGTWTSRPTLNFVAPTTVTVGAKDGNAAANRTALSSSITSLTIANGATFWIRWTDTDASGADDGLAVDDFELTPSTTTAATVTVGGQVLNAEGRGIMNATVNLTDSLGQTRTIKTSSFGYFRFPDVNAGETYFISVSSKRYTFAQSTRTVTPNESISDLNFISLD